MSISVCETIGNGRDGLLPLLSCETWMLVKEYPDRKKKRKKYFSKISRSRNSLRNYTSKGIPQGTNLQYIKSLTEKWIEMAPLFIQKYYLNLILNELRANGLENYFTTVKAEKILNVIMKHF